MSTPDASPERSTSNEVKDFLSSLRRTTLALKAGTLVQGQYSRFCVVMLRCASEDFQCCACVQRICCACVRRVCTVRIRQPSQLVVRLLILFVDMTCVCTRHMLTRPLYLAGTKRQSGWWAPNAQKPGLLGFRGQHLKRRWEQLNIRQYARGPYLELRTSSQTPAEDCCTKRSG